MKKPMSNQLTFDDSGVRPFVAPHEQEQLLPFARQANQMLLDGTCPGSDFLGWHDLPANYEREEFARILEAADTIRQQSEILVVIGIGGSYLGARAAIEMLRPAWAHLLPAAQRKDPIILFAGNNLSSTALAEMLELVQERDFSINVISKSGTTTEPAIAFRFFRKVLEKKYGRAGARRRIFATTDRRRGALRQLADQEGYTTFVVPDDVGGRFSVLTPVGLLPIAAAGIDIEALMRGASEARNLMIDSDLDNPAVRYAITRHALYQKGKLIELLINYEPRLHYLAEWWKQLFGESEGKDGKGIFPASANFTTDLHSLGQYIQDGRRHLFETLVAVETPLRDLTIEADDDNLDGLNYLAGKTVDYVNKQAARGTREAHIDGGVPNLEVRIPAFDPQHLGALFYFFEKACALSGLMLGLNPFDQPGVEAYKRNMFRLLGKP